MTCGHRSHRARLAAAARARRRSGQVDQGTGRGQAAVVIFSGTIANADEVRELAALGVAGYINEYSAVQHILPSLAPHLFPDSFSRRGVRGSSSAYRCNIGSATRSPQH